MERKLSYEKRVEEGLEYVMVVETRDIGPRSIADCDHEIEELQKHIVGLQKEKAAILAFMG